MLFFCVFVVLCCVGSVMFFVVLICFRYLCVAFVFVCSGLAILSLCVIVVLCCCYSVFLLFCAGLGLVCDVWCVFVLLLLLPSLF